MAKNTAAQRFRESATEEEWLEVVKNHSALTDEEFKKKYGFSWTTIMNDAAERGYYTKKEKPSSSTKKTTFSVAPYPADIKRISRSVQLNENIYTRLQALENDNGQYTHAAILNELLNDALTKYGY